MRVFAIIFFFGKKIPVPSFWQVSGTRVEILKFKKRSESRSLVSQVSSELFLAISNFYETLLVKCFCGGTEVYTAFGPHIAINCSLIITSRRVSCRDISGHLIEAKELLLQLLLPVWAQSLLPRKQRLHFRGMSWPSNNASLCSQGKSL